MSVLNQLLSISCIISETIIAFLPPPEKSKISASSYPLFFLYRKLSVSHVNSSVFPKPSLPLDCTVNDNSIVILLITGNNLLNSHHFHFYCVNIDRFSSLLYLLLHKFSIVSVSILFTFHSILYTLKALIMLLFWWRSHFLFCYPIISYLLLS